MRRNRFFEKEFLEVAVIYFSRAGENYSVGNVKKGNTEILAEIIAKETGSNLFKIELFRKVRRMRKSRQKRTTRQGASGV